MAFLINCPTLQTEQQLALFGVSWQQYETLLATLGNFPGLRMIYLEGALSTGQKLKSLQKFSPFLLLVEQNVAKMIETIAKDTLGFTSMLFEGQGFVMVQPLAREERPS